MKASNLIFLLYFFSLCSSEALADNAYKCSLSGSYRTKYFNMEFEQLNSKTVMVNGPRVSFKDAAIGPVLGEPTMNLMTSGSDQLIIVFSPSGGGNYFSGKAEIDSSIIGFSHGLFDSRTNISGLCTKLED